MGTPQAEAFLSFSVIATLPPRKIQVHEIEKSPESFTLSNDFFHSIKFSPVLFSLLISFRNRALPNLREDRRDRARP